jgi:hypothetical protein
MIQNTVSNVPELSMKQKVMILSHIQYTSLLISAANTYDKQHGTNRMSNRNQNVFHANTDDGDEEFHIDTYLSHVVARKPPIQNQRHKINISDCTNTHRNYIPREDWMRIPE